MRFFIEASSAVLCAVGSLIAFDLFRVMGLVEVLLLVEPPTLLMVVLGMWVFLEAIESGMLKTRRSRNGEKDER